MPSDSREVFELFTKDNDPRDATPLLAYGIVESEKYEWMEHRREQTGTYPTASDVDTWISEKPPQYFDRTLENAFRWMDEFARNLLADEIEEQRKIAAESAVLAEIRQQGSFWQRAKVGVFSGFLSAVIFSLLLYVFAILVFSDISPVGLAREALGLQQP